MGVEGFLTGGGGGLTSPVDPTDGGTGIITYTTGDILYADATNSLAKLPIGSEGQALVVDGSGIPSWQFTGFIEDFPQLKLNEGLEIFSHCNVDIVLQGEFRSSISNSEINVAVDRTGTEATHPGQWRFRLNDNATARANAQWDAIRDSKFGSGSWVLETVFNVETLSTATNEYILINGFCDAANGSAITDGIYFEYDRTNSVNYIAVCEASGTRTEVDTGVAVSTTSTVWPKQRIIVNADATSVTFYIDGSLVATITTNIPSSASHQPYFGIFKSTSTAAQNILYLDYIYVRNQLTTTI